MKSSPATAIAASIVVAMFATAALAYPDKPVQYIIPFAPAGESDVAARLQAQVFQAKYRQEMIVINKPDAPFKTDDITPVYSKTLGLVK